MSSQSGYLDATASAFLAAGQELGYPAGDINAELQDGGFSVPDTTTCSGTLSPRFRPAKILFWLAHHRIGMKMCAIRASPLSRGPHIPVRCRYLQWGAVYKIFNYVVKRNFQKLDQ
jgi:hypothetical protein